MRLKIRVKKHNGTEQIVGEGVGLRIFLLAVLFYLKSFFSLQTL
jgi:hypothetical protein